MNLGRHPPLVKGATQHLALFRAIPPNILCLARRGANPAPVLRESGPTTSPSPAGGRLLNGNFRHVKRGRATGRPTVVSTRTPGPRRTGEGDREARRPNRGRNAFPRNEKPAACTAAGELRSGPLTPAAGVRNASLLRSRPDRRGGATSRPSPSSSCRP